MNNLFQLFRSSVGDPAHPRTRWLYCVECPQYSIQLEALGDCRSGRVQKWQVVKVIWRKAHRRRRRMVQSYSPGGGNVSSHEGTLAPPSEYNWTCAPFSPLESTRQTANRSVQPCLHRWLQSVPILYNGLPVSSSKWPLFTLASGPHNTWFIGPTRVRNVNGNLIVSAVLQGSLVWQTDRATDRPTDHATRYDAA